MGKTWAIVPVKAFDRAKSRLFAVMTGEQRAGLARLMAIEVLRALIRTPEIDAVLLLGQGLEQETLAGRLGCDYTNDRAGLGLSANLTRVVQRPDIRRAKNLLVIPGDLPGLVSADVTRLVRGHKSGVTICRAARDGGTNALLVSSPSGMEFCFGADSANQHIAAARSAGLAVRCLNDSAFARDIDTPDDIRWLCCSNQASDTVRYLQQSGCLLKLNNLLETAVNA